MFGVFIVFAVVIFLILAIGLIFLRFSDVFLVFSIVAFMVLVVFAVMPVVVKRRQRIAVRGMKGMLDLVYDKRLFDMDNIFLESPQVYVGLLFLMRIPQRLRDCWEKDLILMLCSRILVLYVPLFRRQKRQ